MTAPTVVLVPGLWEGVACYDLMKEALARASPAVTDVHGAALRSTGTSSPGNPNMHDDIAGVRAVVEPLVKAGKRVHVVAHSAGGFIAAAAVEDLELGGSATAGSGGGVERLFFIAGGLYPAGMEHKPLPFMDFQGNKMYCKEPDKLLFNDVPADVASVYKAKMECQPAENWSGVVPSAGWLKIPSTYLICDNDACLPPEKQKYMADAAKCAIQHAPLGHMAMLADPQAVANKFLETLKA